MRKKRLINLFVFIIGISLIVNLSRNILKTLKASNQIKQAEKRAEELAKEQQSLLEKSQYYQSEAFIEEEARNKLNMSRPGEEIVILPPNVSRILSQKMPNLPQEVPNWQKWWNLFF